MKKLTGEQILEILEENYSVDAFAYDDLYDTKSDIELSKEQEYEIEKARVEKYRLSETWHKETEGLGYKESRNHPSFKKCKEAPSAWELKRDIVTKYLGLGKVVEVEQYGGENQGSTWYSIKHFVDHDVYIKTNGYYQSYSGVDFHDGMGEIVRPKEKTITVFE